MNLNDEKERQARLHQLIDLARIYRGWSKAELARALDRDPTNLYPKHGNAKLDFLMALADALEWPVESVIADLKNISPLSGPNSGPREDYDTLDAQALATLRENRYWEVLEIAQRMYAVAQSGEQRALACNRETGGWDGLGRYTKALEASRRGLREEGLSSELRFMLQSNLANAHYTLWHLREAHGIARDLIDEYVQSPPASRRHRATQAFAYYVSGQTLRRLASVELESTMRHARRAKEYLECSRRLYLELAEAFDHPAYAGIANTCLGGIIEVDVQLGLRQPSEAVDEIYEGLRVSDSESAVAGDWLESYGWWCIFGGNIALRNFSGGQLQRWMGIFTQLALDIANRLDHWALRQQVFLMQFAENQVHRQSTGLDISITVDEEDLRLISGAMGRVPTFREIGWKILQTAKRVTG